MTDVAPSQPTQPPSPGHLTIWLEVLVVLAIGVVPNIVAAINSLLLPEPAEPTPYRLDSFNLIVLGGCTLVATLFIIHRSGEPWRTFGIGPLNGWDAAFAVGIVILLEGMWRLSSPLGPQQYPTTFATPKQPLDLVLMVVRYLFVGFSEEVVCRAYLITRLRALLGSTTGAILFSSCAFASYHIYNGAFATVHTFMIGIVLGLAFALIGRLWPVALAHALYDMHIDLLSVG